jgi:hypothetical protein
LNIGILNTQREIAIENRLRELRERLRTDHLNNEEIRSVLSICEEFNDIFHLQGDLLTTTSAVEHVIPTPSIDSCRGIASRNYRIPEALKGELKQLTEHMLTGSVV